MSNAGQFAPGHAKRGGRRKGRRNKVTADIKALAQTYGHDAILELARLASEAENEQTRVAAIRELLDRGYGKAPQAITGPEGGPLIEVNHAIVMDSIAAKLDRIRAHAMTTRLLESNGAEPNGEAS